MQSPQSVVDNPEPAFLNRLNIVGLPKRIHYFHTSMSSADLATTAPNLGVPCAAHDRLAVSFAGLEPIRASIPSGLDVEIEARHSLSLRLFSRRNRAQGAAGGEPPTGPQFYQRFYAARWRGTCARPTLCSSTAGGLCPAIGDLMMKRITFARTASQLIGCIDGGGSEESAEWSARAVQQTVGPRFSRSDTGRTKKADAAPAGRADRSLRLSLVQRISNVSFGGPATGWGLGDSPSIRRRGSQPPSTTATGRRQSPRFASPRRRRQPRE
jgi:hypothetical protein